MEKYIITKQSVITLSKVIRFSADPEGEIVVECEDGVRERFVNGTYLGEKMCNEFKARYIDFLTNDEKFWDITE